MNRLALMATVLVVARQVVAMLRGWSHEELRVGLEPWQQVFVITVIGVSPWLLAALFWTRFRRPAAFWLRVSMLAGMLFGVYFHFIADTPDHISRLPDHADRGFFVATAGLLVPIEAVTAAFGFWSWNAMGRNGVDAAQHAE